MHKYLRRPSFCYGEDADFSFEQTHAELASDIREFSLDDNELTPQERASMTILPPATPQLGKPLLPVPPNAAPGDHLSAPNKTEDKPGEPGVLAVRGTQPPAKQQSSPDAEAPQSRAKRVKKLPAKEGAKKKPAHPASGSVSKVAKSRQTTAPAPGSSPSETINE